jgi:hypothetical protein
MIAPPAARLRSYLGSAGRAVKSTLLDAALLLAADEADKQPRAAAFGPSAIQETSSTIDRRP